eukprot:8210069-Pyramimonas_sp.AAC.1
MCHAYHADKGRRRYTCVTLRAELRAKRRRRLFRDASRGLHAGLVLLGLGMAVKPLLSHSATGEFNSPPKY